MPIEEIADHRDSTWCGGIVKLVERSEYKRQQAAPVLKVTRSRLAWGDVSHRR